MSDNITFSPNDFDTFLNDIILTVPYIYLSNFMVWLLRIENIDPPIKFCVAKFNHPVARASSSSLDERPAPLERGIETPKHMKGLIGVSIFVNCLILTFGISLV
jgi:hypothetical protein